MINKKSKTSSLGDLLLILRRDILESIKKEGLKHDLTFSQVEILRLIGPNGKITMRDIADYLKVTPPSATEVISEMQKKGLVKRENDKSDRRIVFIVFTKMSKKLFISISRRKDNLLKKIISKLNKNDQKSLERIIRILIS